MNDTLASLTQLARARIAEELGGERVAVVLDERCKAPGASFVTLRWHDGRLQGCIGTLEPRRALADDVARNALAAAFDDPRASPLELDDLGSLQVEVSVLSPLERVAYDGTEAGALAALREGDGVVIVHGAHRGTFLPQMWEQLPTREEFLVELKRKARLAPGFWSREIELHRYTVTKGIG